MFFRLVALAIASLCLAAPALAVTRSWTGAASASWSDPTNWSPAAVPAPGDKLVFPAGVTRTVMTNDLAAGMSVGAMDFRAPYTLNGNALTLTGNVTFTDMVDTRLTWNAGLVLGASVQIGPVDGTFNGPVDPNGHTLTLYASRVTGAINGTGSIVAHSGLSIESSGTFSGTITTGGTLDMTGSLPDASIIASATGALSGNGTVGAVIMQSYDVLSFYSSLQPGSHPHNIGTLHTGSIAIHGRYYVDLLPGGPSDQLQVTGTVTLGEQAFGQQMLYLNVLTGAVGAGQTFTIIDNDGSDPIIGTFERLPEGAQIAVAGGKLAISYVGGDGNDVVLTSVSSTRTWTGASSEFWSNPANWSPAGVPTGGEPLLFPSGVTRTTTINDLPPGMSVGALEFRAPYTLNGNALTLTGNVTFADMVDTRLTWNVGLVLGASVQIGPVDGTFNGPIDPNGHTLTLSASRVTGAINGTGSIVAHSGLSIESSGTFSGTITTGGTLEMTGSLPDASITASATGALSGNGTVGAVIMQSYDVLSFYSSLQPGSHPHNIGTLHTGSIAIHGRYYVDLLPGGASDQLQVNGTVTLGEQAFAQQMLYLNVVTGAVGAGQTFTIIDNDGTDAVDGTFANRPEGSVIALAPWKFRISYAGGDGNDVVLTVIEDTVTAPEQDAETTHFGEAATFTARVTALVGIPEGTVTFTDNGELLKTVPLVDGAASHTTKLDPGQHEVTAVYEGTPVFGPSVASLSHKVMRGQSTAAVMAPATPLLYGDPLPLSISVGPVAPASGTPSGSVTLLNGGASVAEAALEDGQASFSSVVLDAGSYEIAAAYSGDVRFEPSDSASAHLTILKAQTVTDAVASEDGRGATLTVNVVAAYRPALSVTGVVTITEDGVRLAQQPVAAGAAAIALGPLTAGEHRLVVSYLGGSNFEPSSSTIEHTVAPPQVSVRNLIVQEGDSGEKSVTLAVDLSSMAADSVTVAYTLADGTAREGADYRGAAGMLVFSPGEFSKNITLQIYSDTTPEDDETLEVRLASPANATLGQSTATITIANDDLTYRARFGLVYADLATGPLTLDLYTPADGTGPFPLVLWIPGAGSYDASSAVIPALGTTSHGYAVAVARYRTPDVARFPAQLDDLRRAIRWLRANALQHNLDTDRIAVWGISAGAHLASLLGTTNDAVAPGAVSTEVQAVIAWGSASDLLQLQSDAAAATCDASYNDAFSAQSMLLGCPLDTCPENATAASPLTLVTPDDAPFLIMHGTSDCVVPSAQSTRLHEALRSAGVAATLELLDGGAPATWTSPQALIDVRNYLDSQMARRPGKRRAVR